MADRLFPHLENYQLTFSPLPLSSEQINKILTKISPVSYKGQIKEGETPEQLLDRLSKKYEEPYKKWEYTRKKVEPQVWRILVPDSQGNEKPYTSGFLRYVWEHNVIDNPLVKKRVLRRLAAIGNIFIESIKKKYSPEMADKIIKTIFREEIDPNALVILDFEFGQLLARLNKRIEEKGIGMKKDAFYGEIDTFIQSVEEEIAKQKQPIQFEPFESFFFDRSEDDRKRILEGLQVMQEIGWLGHPKVRVLMSLLNEEPVRIDSSLCIEFKNALNRLFIKSVGKTKQRKYPLTTTPFSQKTDENKGGMPITYTIGFGVDTENISFHALGKTGNTNTVWKFYSTETALQEEAHDYDKAVKIDGQLVNASSIVEKLRRTQPVVKINISCPPIQTVVEGYPQAELKKLPPRNPLFFENLSDSEKNKFYSLIIFVYADGRIKTIINERSQNEKSQFETREVILSQGEIADLIDLINDGVCYDLNEIEKARSETRNNAAAEFIRQLRTYQIQLSDWEYLTDQKKAEIWKDFISKTNNPALITILNYFQDQQELKKLPTEIIQALYNLLNNPTQLPVEQREFVEKFTNALNQLIALAEKESDPQKKSRLKNLAEELTQWNQYLTDQEKGLLIALFPSLELPENILRHFEKKVAARKRRKEVDLIIEQQKRAEEERKQAKLEEEKRKRELLFELKNTPYGHEKMLNLIAYFLPPFQFQWDSLSPESLNTIVNELNQTRPENLTSRMVLNPIIKRLRIFKWLREKSKEDPGFVLRVFSANGGNIMNIKDDLLSEIPEIDDKQIEQLIDELIADPNKFLSLLISPLLLSQNPPDETKAGYQ